MANVTVKVDLSGVKKKLSAQNFKKAEFIMANQMISDMDKFVPSSGSTGENLRGNVSVNSHGNIEYRQVYARAQFYGFVTARDGSQIPVRHYTDPVSSKRWDLRAKAQYGQKWANDFLKGL